jgi:hypothetical protein
MLLPGKALGIRCCGRSLICPLVGNLVSLDSLMTWDPPKLSGPSRLTESAFCAEHPSREPLAGAWVVVPYPFECGLGIGEKGD